MIPSNLIEECELLTKECKLLEVNLYNKKIRLAKIKFLLKHNVSPFEELIIICNKKNNAEIKKRLAYYGIIPKYPQKFNWLPDENCVLIRGSTGKYITIDLLKISRFCKLTKQVNMTEFRKLFPLKGE